MKFIRIGTPSLVIPGQFSYRYISVNAIVSIDRNDYRCDDKLCKLDVSWFDGLKLQKTYIDNVASTNAREVGEALNLG